MEPGLDLTCPAVMTWKLPRGHVTLPSDCAGAEECLVWHVQLAGLALTEEPLEERGSWFAVSQYAKASICYCALVKHQQSHIGILKPGFSPTRRHLKPLWCAVVLEPCLLKTFSCDYKCSFQSRSTLENFSSLFWHFGASPTREPRQLPM